MSHHLNMTRLKAVAKVLSNWKEQIVFVGGATTSLYVSNPTAIEVRVTDDVDIAIELVSIGEFYKIQDRLIEIGFQHDTEASIISRFIYQGIKVDFMPTDPNVLGFSNIWYKAGIDDAIDTKLDDGQSIKIFTATYFLASKLEAFKGRGNNDFYSSHDMEDIVFVLDHKEDILFEMNHAPAKVKDYLKSKFNKLLTQNIFKESLYGHVEQLNQVERVNRIFTLLDKFCKE